MFILASVALTAEFVLFANEITFPGSVDCLPENFNATACAGEPVPYALANFLGTISCVLWFQGFVLLLYFLHYEIGADRVTIFAAFVKLVAAVFFNIQPASSLFGRWDNIGDAAFGCSWSNFVGICLFHTGNMISCYAMRNLFDSKRPFSEGNCAVWGMWVYTVATTFLVTADGLEYYGVHEFFVNFGQITGASLLGVGSMIYA